MKRLLRLPKPALAVLLCCTLAACTAADVQRYITLIGQLAVNALTIASAFQGRNVNATDQAAVVKFTDLATKVNGDIQAAYAIYQKDRTAGQPALVSALQAAETELPAFFADTPFISADWGRRIEAASTAMLMGVESVAAFFPQAAPPVKAAGTRMPDGRVYRLPPRVKATVPQIKAYWNANVCQGTVGCAL